MPFVDANKIQNNFVPDTSSFEADATKAQGGGGFFEAAGSAFALYNPVVSLISNDSTLSLFDEYDPEYIPEDNIEGFEDYADVLAQAKDSIHMERLKSDITRQNRHQDVIAKSGGYGIAASLAAGILDPINLFAVGSIAKAGASVNALTKLQRARNIGAAALTTGGATAGSVAISEAALQATQPSKTAEESFKDIGAGALLGGFLGGGVTSIRQGDFSRLASRFKEDFSKVELTPERKVELDNATIKSQNKSVGAAEAPRLSAEDLELVSTFGFAKLTSFLTPTLRVMNGTSAVAKDVYVKLADMPLKLKGAERGIAIPQAAESAAKLYDKNLRDSVVAKNEGFKALRKAMVERGEKPLTQAAFKTRVTQAMRRGDVDINGENAITETAKKIRVSLFNSLKNEAVKVDLLPENIRAKFADSYITRLWNSKKIIENEPVFREKLSVWANKEVRAQIKEVSEKFAREADKVRVKMLGADDVTKAKLAKEIDNIEIKRNEELDAYFDVDSESSVAQYVSDVVDEITAKLKGTHRDNSVPSYLAPVARGPIKEKLLSVNDIDFEEFLDNDIDNIMSYYRHHMGTQIELKRSFGNVDLKDQIKEIQDDYEKLSKAAPDAKSRKKINKEKNQTIEDIEGVRDILLGRFDQSDPDKAWSQGTTALRDINYMRSLGGVVLSSIPDVFRPMMINGLENAFPKLNLGGLSKIVRKASSEELREAALDIEVEISSRLQSLAEMGDPLNRGSALTRFTGNAANVFSKYTMINYWNDLMKSLAGKSTQRRMIKAIKHNNDQEFLRGVGLDKLTSNLIKEQIKKHGQSVSGMELSGVRNWDIENPAIQDAKRKFLTAIRKESDVQIVTPAAGDLPLFGRTVNGKMLLQFKFFVIGSHSRIFLRALQARGSKEVSGALMASALMTAMGMVVAASKAELSRRSAELRGAKQNFDIATWNKRKWISEGIDRSGLMSVIMEPLNISDKAFGIGVSSLTGQGQSTKRASRTVVGEVLGPSFGTLEDMVYSGRVLASPLSGGEVSAADIYSMRKLLPFQNAFIFRQMFDVLEKKTGEVLGAE